MLMMLGLLVLNSSLGLSTGDICVGLQGLLLASKAFGLFMELFWGLGCRFQGLRFMPTP